MNSRHAALILFVWYLLYPPFNVEKGKVDPSLPLTRWVLVETFNSSADCEARKIPTLEALDGKVHELDATKRDAQRRLRERALCVWSDDPRVRPLRR